MRCTGSIIVFYLFEKSCFGRHPHAGLFPFIVVFLMAMDYFPGKCKKVQRGRLKRELRGTWKLNLPRFGGMQQYFPLIMGNIYIIYTVVGRKKKLTSQDVSCMEAIFDQVYCCVWVPHVSLSLVMCRFEKCYVLR